jgi:hypothetical protein
MTWAWATPLPPTSKLVLMALADIADDYGVCWPSHKTLALKCTLSDRTVQANAGQAARPEAPGRRTTNAQERVKHQQLLPLGSRGATPWTNCPRGWRGAPRGEVVRDQGGGHGCPP